MLYQKILEDLIQIKMSFRSSPKGTEKSRAKTVTTLSGEHDIHAGNILYLDDITLKYE